ncbi:MAG: hypothetical protein JWN89_199 [Parcubacteria group bacterium]|nr:hypothetical protein [Parcubacteria group bacterium]
MMSLKTAQGTPILTPECDRTKELRYYRRRYEQTLGSHHLDPRFTDELDKLSAKINELESVVR